MKNLKDYLIKESSKKYTREEIQKLCPKFWRAVSQFCRDKNTEEGVEYLIDSWTNENFEEFDKKYKNYCPFSDKDLREFEEKFMTDDIIEEIDNIK